LRDSEKKRNEAYEGEVNSGIVGIRKLFENLPELMIPEEAARVLNKSVKTLYDWHYRGKTRKRKIPSNLFLKVGGGLYLRKDILCAWVSDRSSSL
jgi:hypothetical protein